MPKNIVLTLTGPDRIGIVDKVTSVIARRGANVDASRMTRLGGEFAMLVLVSAADQISSVLDLDFKDLRAEGYTISLIQTQDDSRKYAGWLPYEIEVTGADHEGIIHEISHHLASQGINIETMDTSSVPAPMSGTPLFNLKGIVVVPPQPHFHDWSDALDEIGDRLNVAVRVALVR